MKADFQIVGMWLARGGYVIQVVAQVNEDFVMLRDRCSTAYYLKSVASLEKEGAWFFQDEKSATTYVESRRDDGESVSSSPPNPERVARNKLRVIEGMRANGSAQKSVDAICALIGMKPEDGRAAVRLLISEGLLHRVGTSSLDRSYHLPGHPACRCPKTVAQGDVVGGKV